MEARTEDTVAHERRESPREPYRAAPRVALITGRIHEIGIRFEETIDLDDLVPSDEEPEPDC